MGDDLSLFGVTSGVKQKGGERVAGDAYYTPNALAKAVIPLLGIHAGDAVIEPSAGGGSWVRQLLEIGASITAVDIDPDAWVHNPSAQLYAAGAAERAGWDGSYRSICADFLAWEPPAPRTPLLVTARPYRWAVGNPPFNVGEAHARKALQVSERVAFLLRGGFLASQERIPFWKQFGPHLTDLWFLQERPLEWDASYDYAIFLWDQRVRVDYARTHFLSWRS